MCPVVANLCRICLSGVRKLLLKCYSNENNRLARTSDWRKPLPLYSIKEEQTLRWKTNQNSMGIVTDLHAAACSRAGILVVEPVSV